MKKCDNKKVREVLYQWAYKELTGEINLELDDYIDLRKYQYDLMVNICYHGMKDFQRGNFSIETINNSFLDVIGLSSAILEKSVGTEEEVVELLESADGKVLMYTTRVLKVPITDKAWKLTPMQIKFFSGSAVKTESLDDESYIERVKAMFNVSGSN